MHTLEAAQEPILSAVAHEAAGPAVTHDENSNPALIFVEQVVGTGVEACAAFLVAAEIAVLFVGVVSRYVFRSPIVWSDELASFLFLWLAMLGSVVAFRNTGHMRMTALVSKAQPRVQTFFDLLATVASVAFLLLTIGPAFEFAHEERLITTPALEISGAWRASALPVGIGLMLMTGSISLLRSRHRLAALSAILAVAALVGAFYAASGVFPKFGNYNLLLFFVGIVGALVFAGVPIAFAFGLATVGYIALATRVPTLVVLGRMDEGMSHLILLAVPLFVFLGLLIEMTGMARAMVGFLASLLGHVRGGLHYVLIGAMYLVSGISGAKPGDLVALLSATGAQTETIPPSLVLITIGSVTGVSIAALFTGGMLPGVVLAIMLGFLVWWRYRNEDLSHVKRATMREVG